MENVLIAKVSLYRWTVISALNILQSVGLINIINQSLIGVKTVQIIQYHLWTASFA